MTLVVKPFLDNFKYQGIDIIKWKICQHPYSISTPVGLLDCHLLNQSHDDYHLLFEAYWSALTRCSCFKCRSPSVLNKLVFSHHWIACACKWLSLEKTVPYLYHLGASIQNEIIVAYSENAFQAFEGITIKLRSKLIPNVLVCEVIINGFIFKVFFLLNRVNWCHSHLSEWTCCWGGQRLKIT